jgi:hypothetical protein
MIITALNHQPGPRVPFGNRAIAACLCGGAWLAWLYPLGLVA